MIDIQVGVGVWNKPFVVLDPEDDEEVGRAVGAVVGWMLHILADYRAQGNKEVKQL